MSKSDYTLISYTTTVIFHKCPPIDLLSYFYFSGVNNKMKDHTVGESILKNIQAGRASCAWLMPVSSRKTSISLKTKRSVSFNEKNLVQLPITDTAKIALHQDEAPDELSPLDIIPQSKRKTYTLKKQSVRKTSLLSKKCRESNSSDVLNCLSVENEPKSINKPMSTQQEVEPALNCDKNNIDQPLLTEEKSPKDITSNNNNVVPFKVIEDSKGMEDDKVIEENNGESKLFIEKCENDVESGQVLATEIEKVTVRKSVRKRKPINYNNETKVDCQEPLTKRKRGRPSKSIKNLEQKASENIDKKVSDNNESSKAPNEKTNKTVMKKTIVDEKPSGNIEENVSNKESSEAPSKKSSKRVIKKTTVEETPSENIDENVSSKTSSEKKFLKKSSKTVVNKTTVGEIPFENIDENVSKKESSKAPIKKTSKGVVKKTVAKQILKSQKQTIEENSSCLTNDKGLEDIEHRVKQEEESRPSSKSKKKVLKEGVPKTAPANSKKHLNNEQIKSDEILGKFCTVF